MEIKMIVKKIQEKFLNNNSLFYKFHTFEKPDWLTWDIILILISSLFILFGHLVEVISLDFFNKIRIWFFILISSITIIAVFFQICKSYKKDKIIENLEINILLQINTIWNDNDFTIEGNSITRQDDRGTLELKKHDSNDKNGIMLYSENIRFAKKFPNTLSHVDEQIGIVALSAKANPFFPFSGKSINIFKDICVFKVDLKSKVFSNLKTSEIKFIQSEIQVYMNNIKRSSFIVKDQQVLSLKDDVVTININLKNKDDDLFYLLNKKIKSKRSFLKDEYA